MNFKLYKVYVMAFTGYAAPPGGIRKSSFHAYKTIYLPFAPTPGMTLTFDVEGRDPLELQVQQSSWHVEDQYFEVDAEGTEYEENDGFDPVKDDESLFVANGFTIERFERSPSYGHAI